MIADLIFVSVAILGALAGTITDLRERIIPNWITYSMISFGLIGHLIVSLLTKSYLPILYSLGAAGVFFAIAMIMFYTSAWAGGDTKLLIGVGALLPTYPIILKTWLNPSIAFWPFIFTMWINILIFGAIMGLVFGFYIIFKNWIKFISRTKELLSKYRLLIHLVTATALIIIALIYLKLAFSLIIAFIWALCAVFFYLFLFTKAVEDISMYKTLSTKKLMEGDWIIKDVFLKGKLVYKPERTGITQKNIDNLIKLGVKTVEVKEGLPMIPAFLLGLIFSLVFGDILFRIFQTLLP